MRDSQKITLRISEARSELNAAIAARNAVPDGEAVPADLLARMDAATKAVQPLEVELRAALTAESDEDKAAQDAGGAGGTDAEARELAELRSSVSLAAYLVAAVAGRVPSGREGELQAHEGLASGSIPLVAFAPVPAPGAAASREARAATTAPANVGIVQNEVLGRVFANTAAMHLGVEMPTVPVGAASYPVISVGASGATAAADAQVAVTDGTINGYTLSPKRLQASFDVRREDLATLMGMEASLRADLSGAMSEALDAQVIAGDGTGANAGGLLGSGIDEPANPGAGETEATDYIAAFSALVDGRYARTLGDCRVILGNETFVSLHRQFLTNTALSGAGWVKMETGGAQVSAFVPMVSSKRQDSIVARGEARAAVAPVWEGVQIIRDEVTRADRGQIRLTAIMLYAFEVLRAEQFARLRFQVVP